MKKLRLIFIISTVSLLIFSCSSNRRNSNVSQATGLDINSNRGGFQYKTNYKGQEVGPGLVFVPGGTYVKGRVQDDVMRDWNNSPVRVQVRSFFLDETEVTNMMYLEYLDWLERVYKDNPDEKYKEVYFSAIPDTMVWRSPLGFNEDMVNNYLRHPAFRNYPVVGVSWQQAVNFAKWRTERVNESILEREGFLDRAVSLQIDSIIPGNEFYTDTYLKAPNQSYGGNYKDVAGRAAQPKRDADSSSFNFVKRKDGLLLPEYRLPTESEWEYAALGLSGVREYNNYRGKKKYPWSGGSTRTNSRKNEGDQLANFKQGKGDYSGIAGWSNDGSDISAPVRTYPPNDYGLYGMAGNVSEWVADVYRPIINTDVTDLSYYRGNLYSKPEIGPDGKIVVLNEIVIDTMPNNKIYVKSLPGQVKNVEINDGDAKLRANFDRAFNSNFLDGDEKSNPSEEEMYKFAVDNKGQVINDGEKVKSLVSDQTRVVKGGSWKDRSYWLDPSQRRLMPEFMSADYIGFRCAMSYLGATENKKRPRD